MSKQCFFCNAPILDESSGVGYVYITSDGAQKEVPICDNCRYNSCCEYDDTVVKFTVNSLPVAKGRPRFKKAGNWVVPYTPGKTERFEKYVFECWKNQSGKKMADGIPLSMTLRFRFRPPKGISKKLFSWLLGKFRTKKPDLDNLIKSICDALNGAAYSDDSLIVELKATKGYSEEDGVDVIITMCKDNF